MFNKHFIYSDILLMERFMGVFSLIISALFNILNDIYDSGDVREHLTRCNFIALPKKFGVNECDLPWTISLMSYLTDFDVAVMNQKLRKNAVYSLTTLLQKMQEL